ncbi:MAG: aspartate-semialdehyde dehydrogenase [Candidatus Gracilibacteria bacterium]|jgi:aspartate-semialdehyde dehydrogenase
MKSKNIVIVGATGAVGGEMIMCLKKLNFPIKNLRLVASEKSAGQILATPFGKIKIETISEKVFAESDIALFSAGSGISKEWREKVVANKCLMIDNSSAFRNEKGVPLVIPQINAKSALKHKGVISNPNCTTAIAAMALYPLHKAFELKKILVSTYQATSGAGAKGMDELLKQTKTVLENKKVFPEIFQHQIVFNIIPHIDTFEKNGYTREEMKVSWETKKIFGDKKLLISCTAVRIPTLRAHSESIVIETKKPITAEKARKVLQKAKGVEVVDDTARNKYPMPLNASNKFDVEVGRIRQSTVFGKHGLEFFVSGDQLLRGAALNAVEIAKLFI